jgi:hypothetical protein
LDLSGRPHTGRHAPKKKKKLSACRGEGSVAGLQLRVRFLPAALLAMLAKDCTHWLSSVFLKLEIGQVM